LLTGILVFSAVAYSQVKDYENVNYKKFLTVINSKDSIISLPDKFIVKGTVTVFSDSTEILSSYFSIDLRYGKITLSKEFLNIVAADSSRKKQSLIITYRNLPYNIPDTYSRFEILTRLDTLKKDTVQVAEVKQDFIEDIFSGSDLQKSGTIFRGFTIGNNRDLTLNSGFRLQMNGKLSKDIEITAALTDESTPIQPEGTTQKLQELDKVFVELRTSNITTTLGDIDVNFGNTEFFNFSKKLQGAKGFANFGKNNFFVSAALERGKFASNNLNGSDGVQGPYRLVGSDNSINIVVIAGSEKVYLDGIKMERGETNDYTVDYSNGQITFTNRRLITNASRIVVDFEYSDKNYSRSLIAAQTNNMFFNERLKLSLSFFREKDDINKPIEFILSDSDKTILSQAGNDRLKASKSGVVYVGKDTANHPLGQYVQLRDSLNNIYYKYQPANDSALYQVTFSYVGSGKGDYTSQSTTVFTFAGKLQGDYLPIVFLPLPVRYQSVDAGIDLKITKSLSFAIESAVSDFDRNLFSDIDDNGNKGVAVNSSLTFNTDNLRIGKSDFGKVLFSFKQRYLNKQYNAIDRINQVEYNRIWDIVDSTNQTENSSVIDLQFKPRSYLYLTTGGGRIKRGDSFNSLRGNVDMGFKGDSLSLPSVNYNADYISSKDNTIDYKGLWLRQNGMINYKLTPKKEKSGFGDYNFIFEFTGEDKQIRSLKYDTTSIGSFRYYEFKPKLVVAGLLSKFDLTYQFDYRRDDLYNAGTLSRESNSYIHSSSLRVKNFDFFTSSIDLVVYDKKYSDIFKSLGYLDSRTILVTSLSSLWFFNRALQSNLFYKVSSERSAKQEVIFVKVPLGQGNYKYIGDINGNGIQDENEFILVNYDGDYIKIIRPTDQLFPTTDLQSSVSVSLNPSRLYFVKAEGAIKDIIDNLSFDTFLQVAEKSKDPVQKDIYLLKFSTFLNDENTITGSNKVQQDINLFENNQYFAIRLRFIQNKGFNQYYSGNERLLGIERSTRVRLSFTNDLSLITDYSSETKRNLAPNNQTRNWDINSQDVSSDLSYKPIPAIEAGFKLDVKKSSDLFPFSPTNANINSQTFRFSYAFESKGRVRVEVSRNEAIITTTPDFVPYDLTNGLVVGKSYLWTVTFDYRISNFIQATVNYFGRAEGNSKVIHTGTAELRAYF
jgi:hypothetical protein